MLNSLGYVASGIEAKVTYIRIREHTFLGKRGKARLLENGCHIEMVQLKHRLGL